MTMLEVLNKVEEFKNLVGTEIRTVERVEELEIYIVDCVFTTDYKVELIEYNEDIEEEFLYWLEENCNSCEYALSNYYCFDDFTVVYKYINK